MLPGFPQAHTNLERLDGLRILRFGSSFNEPTFEHLKLPDSLTELDIGWLNQPFMRSWTSPSLTSLRCYSSCPLSGDPIQLELAQLTFTLKPNHVQHVSSPSSSVSTSPPSELLLAPCLAPLNFRAHLSHIQIASDNPNLSDVAGELLYPSLTSIVLAGGALFSLYDWSAVPQLREMIFFISHHQPLTTTIPLRFSHTLRRLEFRYTWPSDNWPQMLIDQLPPQLECLNCNGAGGFQWIHKPPNAQFPKTMRRIELFKANDYWLILDVPPECIFYESLGNASNYKQVQSERFVAARQRHLEETQGLLEYHCQRNLNG